MTATKASDAASEKNAIHGDETLPEYTPRSTSQPLPTRPATPPRPATPAHSVPAAHTSSLTRDVSDLRAHSANVVCPRCHHGIMTQTRSRVGTNAGVWSLIACFACGVIGAVVPLLMRETKDVEHSCSNCGFLMARFRRGHDTLVFPVGEERYVAVATEDHRPASPIQRQETGVVEVTKY